jgi:hypothetical protein
MIFSDWYSYAGKSASSSTLLSLALSLSLSTTLPTRPATISLSLYLNGNTSLSISVSERQSSITPSSDFPFTDRQPLRLLLLHRVASAALLPADNRVASSSGNRLIQLAVSTIKTSKTGRQGKKVNLH